MIYQKVCDLIILQIKGKFSHHGYWQAAQLFNSQEPKYSKDF